NNRVPGGEGEASSLHGGIVEAKLHNSLEPTALPNQGTALMDKLLEALSHMVSSLLKVRVEEIDAETPLSEYGFDSITFTEFGKRLNQSYQLDLTPAHFFEYSTLERLSQYLHANYASTLAVYFLGTRTGASPSPTAPLPPLSEQVSMGTPIAIIGMSG